jgi:ferredoxin
VFSEDVTAHLLRDGCRKPVRNVLPLPESENPTGHRLAVDWSRCDGHGLCGHLAPELIRLDGNGYPTFADAPVPVWLEPSARKAVAMCPALALRLTKGNHEKRPPNGAARRRTPAQA